MKLLKAVTAILCLMVIPNIFIGQEVQNWSDPNNMMIKDQQFEIYAVRNAEQVHKSTREVSVLLNYVTGEFYCGVQQKDIQLLDDDELPDNVERDDRPYFQIKGTMPMEQMQYNEATDQAYKVELELIINGQTAKLVFDVLVKNYGQTSGGFRQFLGSADFDVRDIGITEFVGYEPEIKLVFSFQAFSKRR